MKDRSPKEILQDNVFSMVEKNNLMGVRNAIQENPWLISSKRWFGNTLLHEACWNDQTEMVELLISLRADVNARTDEGSPPLVSAIYKKASLQTIQVLLENKADLNFGGPYRGPLYWANVNCGQDVVEALLKAGARYRSNEVFASAVMHGDERFVDMLLQNHLSVNTQDDEGRSLLMWAACNSSDTPHYRIAQKLLELKADVNAKDERGQTPLYRAVSGTFRNGFTDLAKLYLAHGANLDTRDDEGVTPLLYAAENGDFPLIQLLAKADIRQVDNDKRTVLHYAAKNWDKNVCAYFIDKGLNVNAQDKSGMTPLHYACYHHKFENARALLKAGAKASIADLSGKTPLDLLRKYPDVHDSQYEAWVKILNQVEIIENSEHIKQNKPIWMPATEDKREIHAESKLIAPSIRLTSGNFSIDVDKQALSEKSEYFKAFFYLSNLDKSDKKEMDVSNQFDEHIFRSIITIFSGIKNVVKSLYTAIKLFIAGDTIQSKEITQTSLDYIRQMDSGEFNKLKENSKKHRIISNLVSNVETMLAKYPLRLEDLLPHVTHQYLNGDISTHINNMTKVSKKLQELTHLEWEFNGITFKSDSCDDWYPNEPKHPNKYSNVVSNVLIARGILSGDYSSSKSSFSKDWNRWNCQLVDEAALLKLDSKQLRKDIEEASDLITQITKAPCNFLHIYPVKNASYYEVLEQIGCIKVDEYMAFNAQAIDFDLNKLRQLKDENISMKDIWERYQKADRSKPIFEQVCKKQAFKLPQQAGSPLLFPAREDRLTTEVSSPKRAKFF